MDAIGSILTIIFVAILIGVAITFGFALLAFIICVAAVTALLITARQWWYRWRFVQNAEHMEEKTTIQIIEGQYQDISDRKD